MLENTLKNDQEIYAMAVKEWTEVLVQLWEAFGKELDLNQLKIYKRNLKSVPLGLLERAVDRVVREHSYNSVPAVGDVWKAVKKELQIDGVYWESLGIDTALSVWIERQRPW